MPNLKKIHIKDMNKNVKDIVDKNVYRLQIGI